MRPHGRGRRGSEVAAAVERLQQQARALDGDELQWPPSSYDGADRIYPAEPWSPERAREFDRRPAGARLSLIHI